jgi:DNA-binding MltR family transcriptional regulator
MAKKKASAKIPELSADSVRFVEDLQKETDRGAALVAAAFADNVLDSMLRSFFVDDKKVVDEVLSPYGAVGSFSGRISLAYCLGLIGKQHLNDLTIMRKIRNEFAHLDRPVMFNMPRVRKLCGQLVTPQILRLQASSPRDTFIMSAVMVTMQLLLGGLPLKHRAVPKDFELAEVVKA